MDRNEMLEMMARESGDAAQAVAPTEVVELAEEMKRLGRELNPKIDGSLANNLSEIKQQYDDIRHNMLPQAMATAGLVSDSGTGKFSMQDGSTVSLRNTVHSSVKATDKERFHAWLRSQGLGDIIREAVHPQTLKAFVREQLEEGNELPEYVQAFYETAATIRRR